ncbi:LOW QUALITY PROTEIN: uncharacterized protein EMH_0066320 [Eimeria mitis]|uniref:Uncharacterized protein n=1 Tax=Eimeria mitis TaxID=44415 RepID=U6KDX1_9EIME|nr:LOW QUALITY PROTEIN: uncharacterized protein EMH_0066320 [Eimeria mitis]CDJ36149.1 hypothetical protein, conserved [Eimeria mitis]
MQISSAVEPGVVPTSLLLLGSGGGGWEVPREEFVSAVTSKRLPQKRDGRFGGLSLSVAFLTAVTTAAAVYLVLRCALYLTNVNKSRASLRFLAGSEEATNRDPGYSCRAPKEDRPAAAAAASSVDESGPLDEQDLLARARRYTVELALLVKTSEPLVRQLSFDLRFKCIKTLLCLSLVETSALFSLLERRERSGMDADIYAIYRRIRTLRDTLTKDKIGRARERHINHLHKFLGRVQEIEPAASSLATRQRLSRIEQLLQLQEIALTQVNIGLFWLRGSLESSRDVGAADAAVEVTTTHTKGGAATSAEDQTATAATPSSVIAAIATTVYTRREHVLNDPLLSRWLRGVQPRHYGLLNRTRMDEIAQRPLLSHPELVDGMLATPLGLGYLPCEYISAEEIDPQQETASSSVREAASRRDGVSPQDDLSLRAGVSSKHPQQHSGKRAGAVVSTPGSASPSISTAGVGAPAAQSQQRLLRARNQGNPVFRHKAPTAPQQVSWPAAPGRLQGSAVSAAPEPAAVPSAPTRAQQVTWASKVSDATSAEKTLRTPPSPELLPKPSPTFFRAAVSSAAAYAPEALTLRPPAAATQAPVSSAPHSASVATPVKPGLLPAPATARLPAPASRSPKAGIDRKASSSRHRRGPPSPSGPQLHKFSSRSPASAGGTGAWPLQTRGGAEGSFPGTGKFVWTSSASLLQRPTSQPLPPSPWIPAKYRSALGIANPEGSQDIDTWPFSFVQP